MGGGGRLAPASPVSGADSAGVPMTHAGSECRFPVSGLLCGRDAEVLRNGSHTCIFGLQGRKREICVFEEEEIPFARNLLICTLANCKHRPQHENESCGFLHISAN